MEQEGATAAGVTGYQIDDLIINLGQQRVTRDGTEIPLPHLSFDLLVTLAQAAPNFVSFDHLTQRVWPGLVIALRPSVSASSWSVMLSVMTRTRRATSPEFAAVDTGWWPQSGRSRTGRRSTRWTPPVT